MPKTDPRTTFADKAKSAGLVIKDVQLMKYQLNIIERLELTHLDEIVREQLQDVYEDEINFGGLAKLTSDGGLRLKRAELTESSVNFLNCWASLMCVVALISLCITFTVFLGLTELRCQDCPEFNRSAISAQAHFVDKLFFPRDGCIADWTRNAYAGKQGTPTPTPICAVSTDQQYACICRCFDCTLGACMCDFFCCLSRLATVAAAGGASRELTSTLYPRVMISVASSRVGMKS